MYSIWDGFHFVVGYYIYMDAATGSRGNKARIYSPSLDDTSEYCVRFYYNMNGEEMGQLNLFYVREGTAFSTTWTPPFSLKTGRSYGDQWIGAAYTVAKFNVSKQIVLEAVRGNSSTSYIAVDDIRATKGRCETAGAVILGLYIMLHHLFADAGWWATFTPMADEV